tara:strand:+ start:2377 stop:3345 length:969 start_codon:yes stop_codon:yes gene_type:complete
MINSRNFKNKKLSLLSKILSRINIKFFVTLICFLFLGTSIYVNHKALASQTIGLEEIFWLMGGIGFSFLSIIINAFAWKSLIESIGCDSNKLNIIKIFISTNIYKYLPGGVWHFISRFNILRGQFSIEKSIESVLLEPILMLVSGLIFVPFRDFNFILLIICFSSPLIFLPGLRVFVVGKLKAFKASVFSYKQELTDINFLRNQKNISEEIYYPYKALFIEIIFILFRFLGFLCCLNAFSTGELIPKGQLISSFALAWIIGLVVPAAPGGLGVFESVILFSLGSILLEAPLLTTLLFYRLVSTLSDVLAALIYPFKNFLDFK